MTQLTWDDLMIQGLTLEQSEAWIAPWRGIVVGRFWPEFLTKFGWWFLRRPDGRVEMLDVFTGQLHPAAADREQFIRDVNEIWWQETYLFSELVFALHEAGKIPGPGECYALAPAPALGGPNPANGEPVDLRFVTIIDIGVCQSLYAQSLGLPPG